jgi:peptide/nickel transport system permease protein
VSVQQGWRRLPGRLRAGVVLLGALAAVALCGPLLTRDPTTVLDPAAAALLPPGASRVLVTLADGSTIVGDAARREQGEWRVTRLGAERTIPTDRVAQVARHRFWLGSDSVGRDVLARLCAGGRVSLGVGTLALVVALLIGLATGLVSGWSGGVVDAVLMRVVDAALAVPTLFLLLFLAAILRPSLTALILVLGLSSWMGVARLMRGQVLSLKERDFILAARAIGASPGRIAAFHLLPNALTPIVQDAALRLGDLILVEASLSFLGLGVQPPTASWGSMVAEGQEMLASAWWLTALPSVLVALAVIGAGLVADGIQELSRREASAS